MTEDIHPDATLVQRLQARFARFATHEVPDDPLYVAIAEAVAARADWAAWLADAPATQQLPNLWLAALQDRLLERAGAGARPPLADYYASAGGRRLPDAAFAACLAEFVDAEEASLRVRIATRTTQTNEIGRCAVLWPILRALASRTGHGRMALLDVGCSAGLNLGVDRWRYRYVDDLSDATLAVVDGAGPGAPEIACRVARAADGGSTLPVADGPAPEIVSRLGIDPSPIDVADAAAVRWLRACLWPHDTVRRERFDAAVAVARAQRWPVHAAADTLAATRDWLHALPPDVTPVIFNSWVLAYFDAAALDDHVAQLKRWILERGAVWISAESPALARRWWPELPEPPAPAPGGRVGAEEMARTSTAWTVASAGVDGAIDWRFAARSHAHGRWLQWLAA
jgi:hypothetical protein